MGLGLFRTYRRLCEAAGFPVFASALLQSDCGRQYGVTTGQKLARARDPTQRAEHRERHGLDGAPFTL